MSEENADNNPNKKRSRKKRKNFLANAKKYAKKGQMGRGCRIPEELYQYFVGILDVMKQGIEDKEERRKLYIKHSIVLILLVFIFCSSHSLVDTIFEHVMHHVVMARNHWE